ncbi:MAG: hypothetical protein RMK99_15225 [Anaerolineales bacterium]|nr:hypothetical protein [Anaerolineales bacterium]
MRTGRHALLNALLLTSLLVCAQPVAWPACAQPVAGPTPAAALAPTQPRR